MIIALTVTVVVVIAALAFNSGIFNNGGTNDNGNNNLNPNKGNNENPEPILRDQIADITLSGSDNMVTEDFELPVGVAIFRLNCTNYADNSCFYAYLFNDTGSLVYVLAGKDGYQAYESILLLGIGDHCSIKPAEAFHIEVMASCDWTITIEQPRVAAGGEVPSTLVGCGDFVAEPFYLSEGTYTFNWTHFGYCRFFIILCADDGTYWSKIVQGYGSTENDESTVYIEPGEWTANPGIYWLSVDMVEGGVLSPYDDWSIKITKNQS